MYVIVDNLCQSEIFTSGVDLCSNYSHTKCENISASYKCACRDEFSKYNSSISNGIEVEACNPTSNLNIFIIIVAILIIIIVSIIIIISALIVFIIIKLRKQPSSSNKNQENFLSPVELNPLNLENANPLYQAPSSNPNLVFTQGIPANQILSGDDMSSAFLQNDYSKDFKNLDPAIKGLNSARDEWTKNKLNEIRGQTVCGKPSEGHPMLMERTYSEPRIDPHQDEGVPERIYYTPHEEQSINSEIINTKPFVLERTSCVRNMANQGN